MFEYIAEGRESLLWNRVQDIEVGSIWVVSVIENEVLVEEHGTMSA
jgi:hypothetical protein